MLQPFCRRQVVVEDRDRVRDGAVREVEDARRRVREDQSERRDRVDAADDQPADDVRRHAVPSSRRDLRNATGDERVHGSSPASTTVTMVYAGGAVVVGGATVVVGQRPWDLVVDDLLLAAERLAAELRHELLVLDLDVVDAEERLVVDLGEVQRSGTSPSAV